MIVEFVGKFYDNHSLSIVNRNLVLNMVSKGIDVSIVPLDSYDPKFNLSKNTIKSLKELEISEPRKSDIQIRHTYPPVWDWPAYENTKIVYIQPWEFTKAPFEWQYKFETFADALVVPSNFVKSTFLKGGIKPTNIVTVPNGYDPELFNFESATEDTYKIKDNKTNFLFVGNTQWRKGLDILLNIWPKLFRGYDNARLIIKDNPSIYGTSNILSEIIRIQYESDCAEILYIDDDLSDADMANLYKLSQILVHPYRAEGFGMHVQEAVACGCYPIISSNGPTDDFIPDEASIKIPTQRKPINITDPKIFAMKPGDASTMMGSHTFANEPDVNSLANALNYVYTSHNKKELFNKVKDINTLTTWSDATDIFIAAMEVVANRDYTTRK